MPKATAVWLVENTSLTFDQIAAFCTLHPLEVQGVADGDVAQGIMGMNPIQNGQLTLEEIRKAEADPSYRMVRSEPKVHVPQQTRKGPRYTPVSKRQEKPNAILWLVRNHPELKDSQIMRLVGTTKPTIESVRERTHWNSSNQTPLDPVTIGLCTQAELDAEVRKAAKDAPAKEDDMPKTGLMSAEEALARAAAEAAANPAMTPDGERRPGDQVTAETLFSGLKNRQRTSDDS
jgi:hypothetical protein